MEAAGCSGSWITRPRPSTAPTRAVSSSPGALIKLYPVKTDPETRVFLVADREPLLTELIVASIRFSLVLGAETFDSELFRS